MGGENARIRVDVDVNVCVYGCDVYGSICVKYVR